MGITYSKTPNSITVVVGSTPKTIPSTHVNFTQIVKLARDPQTTEAQITPLLDVGKALTAATNGNITVQNGRLYMKGFEVKSSLANTIIQFFREGNEAGAEPLKLFMEKAWANPDPRAAADLFDWVVNSKLPITPDGDILAWKAVRDDYYSIHGNGGRHAEARDKRFDHHPGNVVEEDRTKCDPNPDVTCSRGLHFCAASYLPSYATGGDRVVAVAISPSDVVAFPRDYNGAKGRAFRYTVVGEVPQDQVNEFYPSAKRVYKWQPATPGQSKTGDVWQTRSGDERTIIRTNAPNGSYSVQTDRGWYTATGRYLSDTEEHPLDLVKYIR